MVYKKIQNETGQYIDKKEVRFTILEANEAYTPKGINVGWEVFDSIGAATQAYGLTYNPLPAEGEA